MRDLRSSKLIWLKAILFLVIGGTAAGLLWVESPCLRTTLLLLLTVWACCRAYYFAFYALEKYVDPQFHYAGLLALLRYICRRNS